MKILVAGGAGYVGRHLVGRLSGRGHHPVVYDNLSTGSDAFIGSVQFVRGDISDRPLLDTVLRTGGFDGVVDCAGVGGREGSGADPLWIFRDGYAAFLNLAEACVAAGIGTFVYVSTTDADAAGPFRWAEHGTASEGARWVRARAAWMVERTLLDLGRAGSVRPVVLRVPHVAGADPALEMGDIGEGPRNVIDEAIRVAVGRKAALRLRSGFSTSDGTAVREYVHVDDVAEAVLLALEYLGEGGESAVLSCGYGRGYSDREVGERVRQAAGIEFPILEEETTGASFPECPVDASELRARLGWTPRHDDNLATIIRTALRWERKRERKSLTD